MIRVSENDFSKYISWAMNCSSNQVYPLSITEGIQSGDIYVDAPENPGMVLFWHYCGFAYISGVASRKNLEEIEKDICHKNKRRMLLITDDDFVLRFFSNSGKEIGRRIEYEYTGGSSINGQIHGIDIRRIDAENISAINGKITPSFSWEDSEFLNRGIGYAAFDHDRFCSVAFSAAMSSVEIDIGVEVSPLYRGRGIATTLVREMCVEIISQGKRPVWAHAEQNVGSMRTAIRSGFVQKKVNGTICLKKAE